MAAVGAVLVGAACERDSDGATVGAGQSLSPARQTVLKAKPMVLRVNPTVLEVTCTATGINVSGRTAVVGREGLLVKVTNNSGLKGLYLNYASGTPDGATGGGGNEIPAGTTERVLMVPPGDVYLDCSHDEGAKDTAKIKVRASDPNGYYRHATIASLGCTSPTPADWPPGPGRGKTPQAALDALAVVSKEPGTRARLAPVGYAHPGFTLYLLERGGKPWATAVVSSEGGKHEARLSDLCLDAALLHRLGIT